MTTMMSKAQSIAKREHAKFKRNPCENAGQKALRNFEDDCLKIIHDYSGDITQEQKKDAQEASVWLYDYLTSMEA